MIETAEKRTIPRFMALGFICSELFTFKMCESVIL